MNQTSNYWKKRTEVERAWQIKAEKDQRFFNTIIEAGYKNTLDEINRQIKADLAFSGGKLINAKGMQEYENLAKQAVAKAKELRKGGHHVTRKDFGDDVNRRLKVYNATMRINRNEMLKSKIGARLVELGIDQEGQLTSKLWNDYTKEKERQAGILGITAKSNLWTSKEVHKAIYAQIEGADFSKRVWANIDQLKANLDGLVSTAIIRGDNPREMARWLVDNVSETFENKKYATERLARTEMARVQFEAEKRSIIDNDYKYVQWFAEAQACKICREIADQDTEWGRGVYKVKEVPDIPVHPNCMCSISAYWVDDDKSKPIKEVLDDEELVEKYLNSKINGYIGEEDSINLAKKLDQAPDDIKRVWVKYHDKLKLDNYKEGRGTSFYRPGKGVTIYRKSMNLPDDPKYYQKKYDVFFHEFGHMIDHLASDSIPDTAFLDYSKKASNLIIDNIDNDWDNLIDSKYQKLVKNLKFSRVQGNKAEIDGIPGFWIKLKKNGEPTVASLRQVKVQEKENVVKQIKDDLKSNSLQDKGDLSDFLSGLGNDYPLGVGHPGSYWKRAGRAGRAAEAWAELTSATINNPNSQKILKKYFPSTVKKYHEVLEMIGK